MNPCQKTPLSIFCSLCSLLQKIAYIYMEYRRKYINIIKIKSIISKKCKHFGISFDAGTGSPSYLSQLWSKMAQVLKTLQRDSPFLSRELINSLI